MVFYHVILKVTEAILYKDTGKTFFLPPIQVINFTKKEVLPQKTQSSFTNSITLNSEPW
jgi:hypothetical protein